MANAALDKVTAKPAEKLKRPFGLEEKDFGPFAKEFLEILSRQAFGTLAKREQDILIFHLLSQAPTLAGLNTYQWANLLRISESRVRSLRADAALRFVTRSNRDALILIAQKFLETTETAVEYIKQHGRVKLLLDDPSLQREFAAAVRALGSVPDSSFNREVIEIPATTFVRVFLANFPDQKGGFEAAFKKAVGRDKDGAEFLDEQKSLSERFEAFWAKNKGKSDLFFGLIKVVGELAKVGSMLAKAGAAAAL
jgi:hypothetical protein